MKLKEIYKTSKGVLSHAERDFYIAYCAYADDDGFCFPKISTIADMLGILPQSASRLFKKLVETGFLKKITGGVLCLVGFNSDAAKTKPDVNFSKPDVNTETKPSVNKTKHHVNTTKPDVKLHIKEGTNHLTNQLRKENLTSSEVSAKPAKKPKPVDERKDHPAIKMVHSLITRYPHKDLWDRIIREVGDNPDTEFFRSSYEIWLSVNGNPMNLQKWLFDPAKTGEVPEIYGSKNGEKNGQNHRLSERERQSQRTINTINFADELERQARAELAAMENLSGGNNSDNPKVNLIN